MPETISFGTWLRQKRRALDLTQKALAEQVGCAEITVRRMEADEYRPSNELAFVLFEKLGVPEPEHPQWVRFARGLAGYPNNPTPSHVPEQKTNLPIPLTSFVGREKDVERIQHRLAGHRLVTLIGVGGIGKTRLSQQVASQFLDEYPNGVWLVELASLSDPALVPQTIAEVFGIQQGITIHALVETLIHFLRSKTTLLILDNCEHLLDACAQLIDQLLKNCQNLKILATSREALGIIGEALYQVPALTVPDFQRIKSIEKMNDYESIRLFDERAQLVQMDFALTKENASSVAQICSRLDGIPLAIELAAAKVYMLSTKQIAEQLNQSFNLLTRGSRKALPRQQTIHASIEWSWELLTAPEQILMRQLSVFAGGWMIESSQAICDGDVLDLTNALVKKSLILVDHETGRTTRYRFHEIVRQYAHEKLVVPVEKEDIRTRHLQYFLKFSEQAEPALRGPAQTEWMSRLRDERGNIHTALEWADQTNVEAGLYLLGRLYRFWERSDVREAAHWLTKFIENPESKAFPHARAKALYAQGLILWSLQQFMQARSATQTALDLFRVCGDQQGEIDTLLLLGWHLSDPTENMKCIEPALALAQSLSDVWRQALALFQSGGNYGDHERFKRWEQAITLLRQSGDLGMLANALSTFGYYGMLNGNLELAQRKLEEAVRLNDQLNDKDAKSVLLYSLGQLAIIQGDYGRAYAFYQEAIDHYEKLGHRMSALWCHAHLGYIALREANFKEAHNIFADTIQNFQKDKSENGVAFSLEGMAELCIIGDKPSIAAQLIGWADASRERIYDTRPKLEQADLDKIIAACLAKMGEVAYAEAYDAGKLMTMDEAVALALRES